ncbi:putative membrane protein, partial [Acinetobacter baumannii 42057_3]
MYPLGMFVLWQAIFIIMQLSLTSLNMSQVFVGIISLIINCGMQILI